MGGQTRNRDTAFCRQSLPRDEPHDAYVFNPDNPTRSHLDVDTPTLDQRFVERLEDVLVDTSGTLGAPLAVAGVPLVGLCAARDALDTDFAALLTDVYRDGRPIRLAEGIVRASYRESLKSPSPLQPGPVYEYRIELNATGIELQPGHRIRVGITSCRFPQFDINPNTGAPVGEDLEWRMASPTVHHSRAYPSHVLLSVIPPH